MKRTIKDWLIVLASLLDEAAFVLLVLLILWLLKIPISLTIIIAVILLFIISVFVMHKLVIPALHKRPAMGIDGMLGLECEVKASLVPDGLVRVKGEIWKAHSESGDIEVGESVEIVGCSRLILKVTRKQ